MNASKMILVLTAAATVVFPVLASASVKSDVAQIEAATKKCLDNPDNQSTYGMNECLDQGYQSADRLLNHYYRQILASLEKKTGDQDSDAANVEIHKRLTHAQRAWIAFRDADSTLRGIEMLGGSGEGTVVIGSLYDITKTRVIDLEQIVYGTSR